MLAHSLYIYKVSIYEVLETRFSKLLFIFQVKKIFLTKTEQVIERVDNRESILPETVPENCIECLESFKMC